MSLTSHIKKITVLPSYADVVTKPIFATSEGAKNIFVTNYVSNTQSDSLIAFSALQPSQGVLMSRNIYLQAEVLISMIGNSGSPLIPLFQEGTCAPRCMAFWNAVSNVQLQINSQSINVPIETYFQHLSPYLLNGDFQDEFSGMFAYKDILTDYSQSVGSNQNPLSSLGSEVERPHRYNSGVKILTNTQFSAEVVFQFYSPVPISPLSYTNKYDERSFAHVNDLSISFNMVSDVATRMLSRDLVNSSLLTSVSASFSDPRIKRAELHIKSFSPKEVIPDSATFDFSYFQYSQSPSLTIPPSAQLEMNSNQIRLNSIPHRFYVYVSPSDNQKSIYQPDFLAQIISADLQFANYSSQLNNLQIKDLFRTSKANGLKSTLDIMDRVGVPLCFDFSRDLGLEMGDVISKNGSYNFQLRLQVKNLANYPVNYVMKCVFSYEALLELKASGESFIYNSMIAEYEVPKIVESEKYAHSFEQELSGGNLGSTLKSGLKSAVDFAKSDKARNIAKKTYDIGKKLLPLLIGLTGLGYDQKTAEMICKNHPKVAKHIIEHQMKPKTGMALIGSGLVGNSLIGSAMPMSKKDLYKRLQK